MRCTVGDGECVDGRLRRGLCERHYRRQLHHGTVESTRLDNLTRYTVDENGCWLWGGPLWRNGYGKTSVPIHGTRLAHRAVYIEAMGTVADGLDLDHLCRVRQCVNPKHLEPVSRAVNLARGHAARSVCMNGLHDITREGSLLPDGSQRVECWRSRYRAAGLRYRQRKRVGGVTPFSG